MPVVDCTVSGFTSDSREEYLYGVDVCDIASAISSAEGILSTDRKIEIRSFDPASKNLYKEALLAEWFPSRRHWELHQHNIDRAFREDAE